jgi:RES domain-containing protein
VKPIAGTFYRIIDSARAGDILAPARSFEGRFHHDGQKALYLSQTVEGTHVAMARYKNAATPEQTALPLTLKNAHVLDLRDSAQCGRFHINPSNMNVVWQDLPRPSPTWAISDAARAAGADGLLYPSRSRPDLTHLVLFFWNTPTGPQLCAKI